MSGSTPGGFIVHEGLFRIPDLVTYEQLQDYFRNVFGYHLTLTPLGPDGEPVELDEGEHPTPSPARALGQSFNIAPSVALDGRAGELDDESVRSLMSGVDPVLRGINAKTQPAAYNTEPIGNIPRDDDDRAERVQIVAKSETVTADEARASADTSGLEVDEDDPSVTRAPLVSDEDSTQQVGFDSTYYDDLSVDQLKSELLKRDLPSSGKKNELIARLREDDAKD
jgi:hypothetical protein